MTSGAFASLNGAVAFLTRGAFASMIDSGLVVRKVFCIHHIRPVVSGACEVSRGEKMLYSGTDPESYITEYTLVYEDNRYLCEWQLRNKVYEALLKTGNIKEDQVRATPPAFPDSVLPTHPTATYYPHMTGNIKEDQVPPLVCRASSPASLGFRALPAETKVESGTSQLKIDIGGFPRIW